MSRFVLALDQGTTSSRAIVFDRRGNVRGQAQQEFPQRFPAPGQVEHDPEDIWRSQLAVAAQAMAGAGLAAADLAAVGIANQRETTILWERATGRPVANAIVWQSRVTTPICERLKADGCEAVFRQKTGLLLDAYFSGPKIKHLLDRDPALRARAAAGEVLFGTVDSFLAWRLTGGRRHVTDPGNASRTLLFNIHTLDWDDELLRLLDVPRAMLPEVAPTSGVRGEIGAEWLGGGAAEKALVGAPLAALAGDQQAAAFGQACFTPGSAKNTYGTGCFLLLNCGDRPRISNHGLLCTVGWNVGGRVTYFLEGAVFVGGAVVRWLRDGLGLIRSSDEIESLAASVPDNGGVYFPPAFVGWGAPRWDPRARGAIFGLTLGAKAGHLARAALEAMAFQSRDVLAAMQQDSGLPLEGLKVDGGAARNDLLMRFQADLLDAVVRRPTNAETTSLGAAYLAGLAVGYWRDQAEVAANWRLDREFRPAMPPARRAELLGRWSEAARRCGGWEPA